MTFPKKTIHPDKLGMDKTRKDSTKSRLVNLKLTGVTHRKAERQAHPSGQLGGSCTTKSPTQVNCPLLMEVGKVAGE